MSELMNDLQESVAYIRSKTTLVPEIGAILGSGWGSYADAIENAVHIPYQSIPHFPHSAAPGHSNELVIGTIEGRTIACMKGRIHYYEGYPMQQIAYPTRVLHQLGVRKLILTNAAGGINTSYNVGDIVFLTDHINFMGTNPLIGMNENALGERFFDMGSVYDASMRKAALQAAQALGIKAYEGVYAAMSGPNYETSAEIRMLRILGADVVGMSTVPEVLACAHMCLPVLAVSLVSNMAAGVTDTPLSSEDVVQTANRRMAELRGLARAIVKSI